MDASRRLRALKRQREHAEHIAMLFFRDDTGEPALFDVDDREALRTVLMIVLRTDASFHRIARRRARAWRLPEIADICEGILARMDSYAKVKLIFEIVVG